MKLKINKILIILLSSFFVSSLLNEIIKNSESLSTLLIRSYLPESSIYSITKEFSMFLLILPPLIESYINKSYKFKSIFIWIITGFTLITYLSYSIINTEIGIEYYLFFWRCFWPVVISLAYINSNIIRQNRFFIINFTKLYIIISGYFILDNIISGSQYLFVARFNSLHSSPNTLGFNSLCCLLILYKTLGSKIFSRENILWTISSCSLILLSLSFANILALIVVILPFIIKYNLNIIQLRINKNFLYFLLILIPTIIYFINLLYQKGIFNLGSEYYNYSLGTRLQIVFDSFLNSKGNLNIIGEPGIYTNIGRIYDSSIGKISDSAIATLIGNFGVIIIPFIIIALFITITNYLLLFKNTFNLNKINNGYNYLIFLSIIISGFGQNIFEVQPMLNLLVICIFNTFINPKKVYPDNIAK